MTRWEFATPLDERVRAEWFDVVLDVQDATMEPRPNQETGGVQSSGFEFKEISVLCPRGFLSILTEHLPVEVFVDWTNIVKFLGGSTLVVGAVAFLAKSLATHFLTIDLERIRGEIKRETDDDLQELRRKQELELQVLREAQEDKMNKLRESHERTLQKIQNEANERIEHVKATLERVERLERDLLKSREAAYGKIWKLTGAVNLFGPTAPVNCADASTNLTRWYFSNGELLTSDSKKLYFLVQELLNFFHFRAIVVNRPSDELLFGGDQRTLDALQSYRAAQLQIPPKDNAANYKYDELETFVKKFKQRKGSVSPEDAWLLLQLVMSAFRSRVVEELGSRDAVHSSPAATSFPN
jgi:hypothetical protein